ncbi:Rieske (2Fe-2S) protein [Frankia sp. CcI156]|jgi:nitrite reductase/ring-hydroxylating ferredoxin subunit|uniref:Rieske (2Fe-2S) protein n=1 Tax=Frankia casuarinae (strain DSM 45818 / CECT 9043 / HFP020203 / CcI3) TaxID=106370 RepID=Q2J9J4_FRACC|nr:MULTISPECIES: aromatic ring-hydroxylating dioxygenase subunit alpha [Frankia]ABD12048.1 Rieske (2Fe-2S) protein [Frankia casuarinae]ETA01983.1 ring-hydroxylating dioxygenase, large terminal subunit [Frankia sp. CcI6]EYT90096.1 ring-hydroxylating dioxygenase, large terminal subunit [Frankia casuarinae]OAA20654.1 ring-hydroxylating dioxygenase, large terminal subunit [Frankia casuarinae]OHV53712.1 Rieske (2Fe-2S) protein [Frankia sp. CgIS1]
MTGSIVTGDLVTAETEPPQPGLAAGWYIALPSEELGKRRGQPLTLFGRELVAWRDGTGRPVIMRRHCPHLGASLAFGKVVDGTLRCPFHHWHFDAAGACTHVPGTDRLPRRVARRSYPTDERYGYVWVWYGNPEPSYPVPAVPALAEGREAYLGYQFSHVTTASPRRVLENAFDCAHFGTLHRVRSGGGLKINILTEPSATAENGPPIGGDASIAAAMETDILDLPPTVRALGIRARKFTLLIDGWPGGQRLTFLLDGHVLAKELLGITPTSDGRTVLQGWSLIRRTGNRALDHLIRLAYRAQHEWGTREDLRIYRHASDVDGTVPVTADHGVLKFRKHYQRWVDAALPDDRACMS